MPDFPEAVDAAEWVIDGTTYEHNGTGTVMAVEYRQSGWETFLTGGNAVAEVYRVGGTETEVERMDRVAVDVYAHGKTRTRRAGNAIKNRLAWQYHVVPDVGVIDRVEVESVPTDVPYASDKVNQNSAVYRLYSRPIG